MTKFFRDVGVIIVAIIVIAALIAAVFLIFPGIKGVFSNDNATETTSPYTDLTDAKYEAIKPVLDANIMRPATETLFRGDYSVPVETFSRTLVALSIHLEVSEPPDFGQFETTERGEITTEAAINALTALDPDYAPPIEIPLYIEDPIAGAQPTQPIPTAITRLQLAELILPLISK